MSLFIQTASRQFSPSSRFTGSLWRVFESLQCHCSDDVVIYGGMTAAPVPIFACKFTPDGLHGNLLATGDEEGSIRLMDSRRPASQSIVKEIAAHRNAVFDVAWLPGGTKLLTASGDCTVRLWDVVGGVMLDEFKAHSGSVKSVDVKIDEPSMFVSGSRDGSIRVWDTRCVRRDSTHKPINSISAAHKKAELVASTAKRRPRGRRSLTVLPTKNVDTKHSVTAVLFHGYHSVASCGTADGLVKLWDLRRTYTNSRLEPPPSWHTFEPLSTEADRPYSFTSLVSGPYQSTLFASCTDNMCYMYNSSGLNKLPVRVFSGHQNSSFYVKSCVSPDGRYLLSGSSCGSAFLWQIDHPKVPPLLLTGHTKEVTAVAWCPTDLSKIVTCSDDNDLRIWRVEHRKSLPGEVTGACESYSGKGYFKGMDILKGQFQRLLTKTAQPRTVLHPIQPGQLSTPQPTRQTDSNICTPTSHTHAHNGGRHHEQCLAKQAAAVVQETKGMKTVGDTSDHIDIKTSWQHVSTSVTPESSLSGYSSAAAKRKLELEESIPKAKRKRTVRSSSSSSRKKSRVKLETLSSDSAKSSGQRTMQSYFGRVSGTQC